MQLHKYATLLVVGSALVMSQNASQAWGGQQGITLRQLAGGYSDSNNGPGGGLAICVSPTSPFPQESCATAGALVIPSLGLNLGQINRDNQGNACGVFSTTVSDIPVDASPPLVFTQQLAVKNLNYDPASESGDESFTSYVEGKCNGAAFDSTGATAITSGTFHFVVSGGGQRIDELLTSFTNPVGAFGDFFGADILLKQ